VGRVEWRWRKRVEGEKERCVEGGYGGRRVGGVGVQGEAGEGEV